MNYTIEYTITERLTDGISMIVEGTAPEHIAGKRFLVIQFGNFFSIEPWSGTIRQWLRYLSEPYRAQALENMYWERQDDLCPCLPKALNNAFNWQLCPQGLDYWAKLHESLLQSPTAP